MSTPDDPGSLEELGGLERRLTLELPAEELERRVTARLGELRRSARLPGFRPGKAPAALLRRRFGAAVKKAETDRLAQSTVRAALAVRGLRPVAAPRLTVEPEGGALRVTATFEVFPPLPAIDLAALEVTVPRVTVSEADVDRMLARLQEERQRGAQRPALDAAFVRSLGIVDGRLETLRRYLAETMEQEAAEAAEAERCDLVEEALVRRHPDLELPAALVEAQVARLREGNTEELSEPEALEAEARRLLRATFLCAEVARQRGLAPDPTRLWQRTRELADLSDDPPAELDRIWGDGQLVQEIEDELLRQDVAAAVLAEARVSEVETTFSELAERRRQRSAYQPSTAPR